MDVNSPLFDRIRIKPRAEEPSASEGPACEHPGCTERGLYKAPRGRGQEGKYWRFCMEHVRAYNSSYNYFKGMSEDAVAAYQKDSIIGHRPTWSMGANAGARARAADAAKEARGKEAQGSAQGRGQGRAQARRSGPARDWSYHDPFDVLRREGVGETKRAPEPPRPRRPGPVRDALDTLGLDESADAAAIKAAFKSLVKRFHPDAHGGDRSFEERLREIIRAHDTLKAAGLC